MKLVYDPGAASPADPSPHAAAGRWLARLRADDRTLADEHAFRQWLARDPANAAHFERVSAVWDYGGGVAPVRSRADAYPPMLARRQVLAGISALVAIGGVSFAAVLADMPEGFRFVVTGPTLGHHGVAVTRWEGGPPGQVTVSGADAVRVADGKLIEHYFFFDPPPA